MTKRAQRCRIRPPLVGASLGALAYQLVRGEQTRPAEPFPDPAGPDREERALEEAR